MPLIDSNSTQQLIRTSLDWYLPSLCTSCSLRPHVTQAEQAANCDLVNLNRCKSKPTTQWAFASGFHCEPEEYRIQTASDSAGLLPKSFRREQRDTMLRSWQGNRKTKDFFQALLCPFSHEILNGLRAFSSKRGSLIARNRLK